MKYFILTILSIISLKIVAQDAPLTFVDPRDEKGYYITKIENLYWFADNLNIPTVSSVCYDNKSENCQKYGQLYTMDEAKSACPTGWRLPNMEDWKKLKNNYGNKADKIAQPNVWKSSKFKNADNESKLTIFPSGLYKNSFGGLWEKAAFWLADENYFWTVKEGKNTTEKYDKNSDIKLAVRCVFGK